MLYSRCSVGFVLLFIPSIALAEDDFERAPINYSRSQPENAITRLQAKINEGRFQLSFDKNQGYLPALLTALKIPESSQMLVFSKTSLQRSRIGPKSPRALYFNDETYLGFCQHGPMLEISAMDPQLGTVFYTLDQNETQRPNFVRQTDACLLCHGSSQTKQIPGNLVRSVFADRTGEAILSMGSFRIDQTTPIDRRWGGWYVTGTHGKQTHMGNLIANHRNDREAIHPNPVGQNLAHLNDHLETSAFRTPYSDIVALMVFEHQTEMHNLITRANFHARMAEHDQALLNRELGRSADYQSETTFRRIKSAGDPLVRYMFFSNEAKLADTIGGSTSFTKDFIGQGVRDAKGRSLRDFDLERRLFKYPCSYLIYSEAFEKLPVTMKSYVYQRMYEVLTDRDYSRDFEQFNVDDRHAILEILRETKKDLPDYWKK